MKKRKVFGLIWVTFGLSFLIWLWNSYWCKGVDNNILQSNSFVHVDFTKDFISFTPLKGYQKVFIFYPGALVDPKAYTTLCRRIADSGYKSIIIKMPW